MKYPIKQCPEGHICTSDCRRNGCPCFEHKHTILSEFARKGGLVKSDAKTKAARENGKKGGRPKGKIDLTKKGEGK